jgi:hypothetical protein
MKHTWTENGYEYFVTDELLHEDKGNGWEYLVGYGVWADSLSACPFDIGKPYRRKLETQELIYCEYFGVNETVTIHGDDFTKVFRGPLEIQALQASRKDAKERVSDEWLDI